MAAPRQVRTLERDATNATATAATGVLAVDDTCDRFGENRAPYVWTQQGGLEVAPEIGWPDDYDFSEARDFAYAFFIATKRIQHAELVVTSTGPASSVVLEDRANQTTQGSRTNRPSFAGLTHPAAKM